MNANRKMIAVSTMTAALAAIAVSFPAAADHREHRRGERQAAVARYAPPPQADVRNVPFPSYAQRHEDYRERREFRHSPPILHQRPVYVQRNVIVERPAPVYYHEPSSAYAYAPAPVYYDQQPAYHEGERSHGGAVAGAVIGGVIGSQVGDRDSRGMTTVIGAILGGILGSGF